MAKKRASRKRSAPRQVKTLGRAGLRKKATPTQVMLPDDECVYVRGLTATEAVEVLKVVRDFKKMDPDSVESTHWLRWKMIQLCACEEDGTRIYDDTDETLSEIKLLPAGTMGPVSIAAMVKNGMAPGDADRLVGNRTPPGTVDGLPPGVTDAAAGRLRTTGRIGSDPVFRVASLPIARAVGRRARERTSGNPGVHHVGHGRRQRGLATQDRRLPHLPPSGRIRTTPADDRRSMGTHHQRMTRTSNASQ